MAKSLGHLMNWVFELSEFDINYLSQNTIKKQVLVDLTTKFTDFPKEIKVALIGEP